MKSLLRPSLALQTRPGNSLIEVIIAMALLFMFTIGFTQLSIDSSTGDFRGRKMSEATAFARQGLEAARSIAEQDFQQLTVGNHGIGIVSGVYAFTGSTNAWNGYTRTITVGLVQRNVAGEIVQSGGTTDYDTRSVLSTVQWTEGSRARSTSLTTYVTDWRKILLAGLTVQKIVINHGGSKVPADFAPYLIGTGTVTLGEAVNLDAGTYTVFEAADPNYIQSFGGDCDASGNVTLDAGDSKTCTITNEEKRAIVTVNKTVINHGGIKTATDFAPYKVGTTTVTLGSGTTIDTGTFTVSETVDPNYLQTFSGDCDAAGQIILAHDDVKTCTITNEQKTLPVVTTPIAAYVASTTVTLGANVTSLGVPAVISARGTCYGTTPAPTTNCTPEGGTTTGNFTQARTGLTPSTRYYFRGYATNAMGTAYSADGTFMTSATATIPTVTTPTVTSVTSTTATLGANVTSLGVPALISARGTCWGTTPAPTTNCVAEGGTTTGVFTQARTGFSAGTLYYFRGYATNATGTAYSADGTFTTTAISSGVMIYGDGTAVPKFRTYNTTSNTFSAEGSVGTSTTGNKFIIRTSPTKREAIAGYYGPTGTLDVFCYNGSTWTKEWSVSIGGNGSRRRFDIAYETNTGDAVILYSRNLASTNEMGYRTKLGSTNCGSSSWSGESTLDSVRTSGVVQWIKLAWDRRTSSNLIAVQWADARSDLSAAIWNGSAWGNEPTSASETSLEVVTSAHDVEDFDLEYESVSGDLMMVWANATGSNGANGVRYRTCTGGTATCTWSALAIPPTFVDDATNLDISANPNTDEIVFASVGNAGGDLQIGYWSGTAWTNTANADISCNVPVATTKMVSTGWLTSGATTRSIVVYGDQGSNLIDWFVGSAGVFTKQVDNAMTPAPSNPNRTTNVQMNPVSKDQLMYTFSDSNNDLFAKRLVMSSSGVFTWTNADGVALETTLPQSVNDPYSFAFWRQ